MKGNVFHGKVEALKAMAERAVEAHRGDGIAEPALELCNAIMEGIEPDDAPEDEPKDSDGGTGDGKKTTAPK